MKYSEGISGFLKFLRSCEENYNIAVSLEKDANDETQDILHRLELHEDKYHDMARIAKAAKKVRKKRRAAKDERVALEPVIRWMRKNDSKEAIRSLEQTLGEVRKAEKGMENRGYMEKTDVLKDVLG